MMKTIFPFIAMIISFMILTSCNKNDQEETLIDVIEQGPSELIVDCGKSLLEANDPHYAQLPTFSEGVKGIRLEDHCLIVDFAYSGCEVHNINVMPRLTGSNIEEGLELKINHLNTDLCLAYFEHTDTFDLYSINNLPNDADIPITIYDWPESFILTTPK